jgi:lipopolysaccharide export system permease protein
LPMGALIGSLLGLSNLARSSELTVIRASGVSTLRIGIWAGLAGLILALVAWFIGDYIAPPLEQYARQQKLLAKSNDIGLTDNLDAWAKDGNTFISAQRKSADNQFGGVYVYRFDEKHRLQSMARADRAHAKGNFTDAAYMDQSALAAPRQQLWQLSDYAESALSTDSGQLHITVTKRPTHEFKTALSADFLGLAAVEPESLPVTVLFRYAQHARANHLDAYDYETELWARFSRTVALVFIVMLAVPFAVAPIRSGNVGLRTVMGSLCGVGFYVFAKVLQDGGHVFGLSPWVIAWAPTLLLATITTVALVRLR